MSDEPAVKVDRRMFLRGAGGAMLALPLFPSLFTSSEAKALPSSLPKCFVHFRTPHGGVMSQNMYPADSTLTEQTTYLHQIRRGALAATVNAAGDAVLSPVLTGKSTVLTPALVAKLNVLRGLDIPRDLVHNFNGCLGYYGRDHQDSTDPRASIDQIMAYSPAVYPSIASVKRRSVVIGSPQSNTQITGYNTPGVRSSGVSGNSIGGTESSLDFFNLLLAGTTSTPTARTPVVDRVLDDYKRLRNGTRRLSAEDKLRLDQHIDAVAELQRRLATQVAASCVVPPRPAVDSLSLRPMDGNPARNVQFFQLINEVIAVAMNCGSTRIACYTFDENNQGLTFTSRAAQGEDWHNNVAHDAESLNANQELVRQFHQGFFSGVFLDLVHRLDSFSDGAGGTLLDHSLVAWGQESGHLTHECITMPVITAGSAGGALKTGSYCDYRNLSSPVDRGRGQLMYTGLLYNQWLTNALLAMGVPSSEWFETTHPGYGARVTYVDKTYFGAAESQVYSNAMWQKTGELLPWLS